MVGLVLKSWLLSFKLYLLCAFINECQELQFNFSSKPLISLTLFTHKVFAKRLLRGLFFILIFVRDVGMVRTEQVYMGLSSHYHIQ